MAETDYITDKSKIRRLPTHIKNLDNALEGGIPDGHITLVCGAAGTMKSSITFNMLYQEVACGRTGLYLSLEQSYKSLLKHMVNMDYDLSKINLIIISDISKINQQIQQIDPNKGALVISDIGAIRKQVKGNEIGPSGDWLNVIKNIIKKLKASARCDLFVLDSMSALYALSQFKEPRSKLFHIFEFLRDMDVTSLLISEVPPDRNGYSEYGVEDYLADGVILLSSTRRDRKEISEITVIKMRTTHCKRDTYILTKDKFGFQALSKMSF